MSATELWDVCIHASKQEYRYERENQRKEKFQIAKKHSPQILTKVQFGFV